MDHPQLVNEEYSTVIISWFDGGLHFFERVPSGGEILLDVYYGSYILTFFVVLFCASRWRKRKSLLIKSYQLYDLFLVSILGVLFGAKFGYVLFYNLEYYLEHPLQILTNWSGMASHGAIAGIALAFWLYTRKAKLSFLHISDHAAIMACVGAIFIRFANFMNGELFGRSASPDLPWAMRFPMRDGLGRRLYLDQQGKEYALEVFAEGQRLEVPYLKALDGSPQHAYESFETVQEQLPNLIEYANQGSSDGPVIQVARMITDASHPSQIYQLLLSGFVLLGVLLLVKRKAQHVGTVSATFLIGYGLSRIAMEFFRQPDPQRGLLFLGLSLGQILSFVLIACGFFVLWYRKRFPLTITELRIAHENELQKRAAANQATQKDSA